MYFSSDCCSVENTHVRLCFRFCCKLECLCTAVSIMQVDGFCILEEFVVVFCNSVESAEVVVYLQCRCQMICLNKFYHCVRHISR